MKSPTLPLILTSFFLSLFGLHAEENTEPVYGKLLSKLKRPLTERISARNLPEEGSGPKSLYSIHHLPRMGDQIIKLDAFYMEEGESGKAVTWDFNHLKLSGEEYEIDYLVSPTSSLTGIENTTMQSYEISEDTLLIRRYENSLNITYLEKPEEIIIFPMSYGDERINYFYGKGKYCDRLELDIAGFTYSLADGYGTLVLPEKDTIYNVLRVYTAKITLTDTRPITMGFDVYSPRAVPLTYDELLDRLESETSYTFTETYRWYAAGSRYPVLETSSSQMIVDNKTVSIANNTYVYHPEDQLFELPLDLSNIAVLEEQMANHSKETQTFGHEETMINHRWISTYPNPVINKLQIDIRPNHSENVDIFIYSLQGHLLFQRDFLVGTDIHHETVDMNLFERGNYILKVQAGEKTESKVIQKQ